MRSWEVVFNNILASGNFNGLSAMVLDMIAKYDNDWRMKVESHTYPTLEIRAGRCYNVTEILSGIRWLISNNLGSFIVTDRSTATLELLYNLLCLNNGKSNKLLYGENNSCSYKVSIDENYYKNVVNAYGSRDAVWGIVVKISRR